MLSFVAVPECRGFSNIEVLRSSSFSSSKGRERGKAVRRTLARLLKLGSAPGQSRAGSRTLGLGSRRPMKEISEKPFY